MRRPVTATTAAAGPLVVGIVGAGTMGAGIAQVCLQAGHTVRLHDVSPQAVAGGRARIADGLGRLVARGDFTAAARAGALRRLHDAADFAALAQGVGRSAAAGTGRPVDLVIEAALEDLELKRAVFRALEPLVEPAAILATNTSALSIDAIAGATARPERVLGLHFFNPAPRMALVEVVAGRADGRGHDAGRSALHDGAGQDAGGVRGCAGLHRQPHQSAVHPGGPADGRGGRGGRGEA